jgi:hypothetical protein
MVACAILVLPMVASAQEEESPKPYVYASYFECAAGSEWMVDGIVEDLYKPVFDAGVEDGTIAGWGWMGHHTGGKWRRLLYRTAPTLEGALEAVGALGKKVFEANPQASAQFGEVCSSHVDYIWQRTAGSGEPSDVGQDNAKAGTSVYLQCDMAREDRADEIVETVFAPIYDRHVAEGNIAGWGWLEHVVGGKYRRIATMGGESHAKILETRGEIIKELWEKHEAEVKEYSSICGSHSDYLWNLLQ